VESLHPVHRRTFDRQAVEDSAQRMPFGEREARFRIEDDVHGGRHGAAAAVAEDSEYRWAISTIFMRHFSVRGRSGLGRMRRR
jgi:hypothetical protein